MGMFDSFDLLNALKLQFKEGALLDSSIFPKNTQTQQTGDTNVILKHHISITHLPGQGLSVICCWFKYNKSVQ